MCLRISVAVAGVWTMIGFCILMSGGSYILDQIYVDYLF